VYGPRLGNVVVQQSDLLLCLGTRLSQNLTGGLLNTFAKHASIVMVDVDQGEMDKFDGRGIQVAVRIQARVADFLEAAKDCMGTYRPPEMQEWSASIESWKTGLPTDIPSRPEDAVNHIDAVHFVQEISEHFSDDEAIFVDTGGNLTWTCNHLKVKRGQRVLSAWNFTPMGYSLPAAIGGASSDPSRPISCIIGDGGLILCLGELATVLRYNLPIKIFLFNNHCHGIQKQTLETWLGANYVGVDPASGLGFPDFAKVAGAMGFPVVTIRQTSDVKNRLREVFRTKGPVFCNVEINPDQKLFPVLKYGHSLEDQMPLIERDKLQQLLSM
jgi:acetolactate synthase-1/2/3 large subunit